VSSARPPLAPPAHQPTSPATPTPTLTLRSRHTAAATATATANHHHHDATAEGLDRYPQPARPGRPVQKTAEGKAEAMLRVLLRWGVLPSGGLLPPRLLRSQRPPLDGVVGRVWGRDAARRGSKYDIFGRHLPGEATRRQRDEA